LTWEKTQTWDAGVDLSFLDSRFTLTFDFYNRLTNNSFYARPVSYMASGQTSITANDASIRNRGIELELGADIIRTSDFSWNVSLNGTHYTTKLVDLPKGAIADNNMLPKGTYEANAEGWSTAGSSDAQGGGFYLRGVGRDWYNLYIRKYAGVDQSTGLPMYWHHVTESDLEVGKYAGSKVGDDIKVNDPNEASKYEVGSAIPKWIGGLTTSLKYKDFDAQIYSKIFSSKYPTTSFVSIGSCLDIENPNNISMKIISQVMQNSEIIKFVDRDDKSTEEVAECTAKGIKVLNRRHVESYILDDEIITKLCNAVGKPDKIAECITAKTEKIAASTARGNAADDIKSASGEIYVELKRILNMTKCGNTKDAFFRDTLAPLITEDTSVYKELEREIFS